MKENSDISRKKLDSQTRKQYMVLAALTHELTGEEEIDVYSYLAKFGISGFFARIDATELPSVIREKLDDLHAYVISCKEKLDDDET
jgi:hypothetical protein